MLSNKCKMVNSKYLNSDISNLKVKYTPEIYPELAYIFKLKAKFIWQTLWWPEFMRIYYKQC